MTPKQKIYKLALIKGLHISSRYINLYKNDDELYREFLKENFGVKSSKDLDIESLKNLVEYMNFQGELKKASTSFKATPNQIDYILHLWDKNSQTKDIFSLLKLVSKLLKKEVQNLAEISKTEAKTIINAVVNIKPPGAVNNLHFKGVNK